MTLSTTFQSKILKMRKRLSKDPWTVALGPVAFLGLLVVLTFAMRTVALPGSFAAIHAEIPVVPVTVNDPAYHRFEEQTRDMLRKTTTAVVLTTDGFYFSDLESFTTKFDDKHDKFLVAHEDGEPQLLSLLTSIQNWMDERKTRYGIRGDGHLVFLPHGDIPMPIVIQTIAGFRQSGMFQRIVLGGGLL